MDNKEYKAYVALWCGLYPVRMEILRCKFRAGSALSKVKRRLIHPYDE